MQWVAPTWHLTLAQIQFQVQVMQLVCIWILSPLARVSLTVWRPHMAHWAPCNNFLGSAHIMVCSIQIPMRLSISRERGELEDNILIGILSRYFIFDIFWYPIKGSLLGSEQIMIGFKNLINDWPYQMHHHVAELQSPTCIYVTANHWNNVISFYVGQGTRSGLLCKWLGSELMLFGHARRHTAQVILNDPPLHIFPIFLLNVTLLSSHRRPIWGQLIRFGYYHCWIELDNFASQKAMWQDGKWVSMTKVQSEGLHCCTD